LTEGEKRIVLSLPLFCGVPKEISEKLLSSHGCAARDFGRGEVVYDHENFKKALAVLLSGRLQVSKKTADGGELIMSALYPPSLFGAAALFNDSGTYASVITAKEDSRVLFLPRAPLLSAMKESPTFAENYIRYLSERIEFLNRRIMRLTAGTAEQRLAGFLLDNLPGETGAARSLPMTDTAKALNMGRASLYRAMERLEKIGAIEKSKDGIIVKNKKILSEV